MRINFRTNQGSRTGEVIKDNSKTVWVKFKYKKNVSDEGVEAVWKKFTAIIKRHKVKHNVYQQENIMEGI